MFSQISNLKNIIGKTTSLKGWVSNKRESKGLLFILLRDGSGFCQCVFSEETLGNALFSKLKSLGLESAIEISGKVISDEKQVGGVEISVIELTILHEGEEYPISKKAHGPDFLLENRHLWLRSKRQWAIMRIRNNIIFSIHSFFQENNFIQMDAPILTGNACEGTSTLFQTDFYDDEAFLSQSGQLYGEAMAMAHGKIYTFGPTFRAEKSKTRRHLSEFWMIEPEMAFCDLEGNMDLIEKLLRHVVRDVLKNCLNELSALERDTEKLRAIDTTFPRITYHEAVEILHGKKTIDGKNVLQVLEQDLIEAGQKIEEIQAEVEKREKITQDTSQKKGIRNFNLNKVADLKNELKFLQEKKQNIPQWLASAKEFSYGSDFGGSDETILTRLFSTPIMIYDWPNEIKAFYMKRATNNSDLARGVDVLAPEGFGEIVGGGERETNIALLEAKIKEHKLPREAFNWYLDLRKYGSVPHSGFGLGLERLVAWICNLSHVRETIPFPRMYGRLYP